MSELANKKHEQFARNLASGNSASQSYINAGYHPCRQNASRLSSRDDIKLRVAEIKERPQSSVEVDGRDIQTGRFLTGNNGGGRPKGSRNKLSEQFISDLHDEWQKSGTVALKAMAENDPAGFVRVTASILPREIDQTISIESELFKEVADFREAWRLARQFIGADDDRLIELQPEDQEPFDVE